MRKLILILLVTLAGHALAEHITVTADEYGANWPYTVDTVEIFCIRNAVFLDADGKRYALNGRAIGRYEGRYPNARTLAKSYEGIPGAKMPPPPGLIQRGLKLCP
jgi:hypothetical protein